MKRWIIKGIETIIIVVISIVCILSILQSTVFKNTGIYGYRTYSIASNSMYPVLEYGDVILVKEISFDDIKVGDIITYMGTMGEFKDKIITHEVIEIVSENGEVTLKTKGRANTGIDPVVHDNQIYGKLEYRFVVISFISKIMKTDLGFFLLVLIPVGFLAFIEIRNFIQETKRRELEKMMENQLSELLSVDDNFDLVEDIENTIYIQLDEIKNAKGNIKKIKELESTVLIDLELIKNEINRVKKKNKKKKNNDKDDDKTVILFSSDDIKKEIEKELKLKNKKTKSKKKNTKLDDKNKKKK